MAMTSRQLRSRLAVSATPPQWFTARAAARLAARRRGAAKRAAAAEEEVCCGCEEYVQYVTSSSV